MSIFSNLPVYGAWSIKDRRSFTQEEMDAVREATVVASDYGNSVCFTMVQGGKTFIPLSNKSTLGVGAVVNLKDAIILTLGRTGAPDIIRIDA